MSGKIPKEVKQAGTAEIEAIRSIIFGDQEKYFTQKILELDEQLKKLQKELTKKFEGLTLRLEKETHELSEQLSSLKEQVEGREQSLEQNVKDVNSHLENWVKELEDKKIDRDLLAQQLNDLAKILHSKS